MVLTVQYKTNNTSNVNLLIVILVILVILVTMIVYLFTSIEAPGDRRRLTARRGRADNYI